MRTDKYVLDDAGNPVPEPDLMKWGKAFETMNRQVARDEIGDARISTVFLGLDHSFDGGNPVLFETMVFGGKFDQECDRYFTRQEALKGHAAWVERVKSAGAEDGALAVRKNENPKEF